MRPIVTLAIVLISSFAQAQSFCSSDDELLTQYWQQKNWQSKEVPGIKGSPALTGFVDGSGNFHLSNIYALAQRKITVQLEGSQRRKDQFRKYCAEPERYYDLLAHRRKTENGVSATVHIDFFPNLKGLSNNPFVDQGYRVRSRDISIEYGSNALMNRSRNSKEVKSQLLRGLVQNLSSRSATELILSIDSKDDLLCDLVSGQATLVFDESWLGQSDKITQVEKVTTDTIADLYQTWQNSVGHVSVENDSWFEAGVDFGLKVARGEISGLSRSQATNLFGTLLKFNSKRFPRLNGTDLQCVSDSLQEYRQYEDHQSIRHEVQLNLGGL